MWQLCVSRPSPSQSLPPLCGTGALQWRIRVISPSPHVTEQDDQGDHKLQPPSWRTANAKHKLLEACYNNRQPAITHKSTFVPLRSHFPKLHLRVWIDGPEHVLLVSSQERPLCWVPLPHVTVHWVHSDHGDQPSSLSIARWRCIIHHQETYKWFVAWFWDYNKIKHHSVHLFLW